MDSLADGLPDEIARQIHPDWRKNEAAYWATRDQLLAQYRDQWIGFANGAVVASGRSPVEVFHAAHRAAEHPFFICVGREEEPCRIRRSSFRYDTSYPGEALPVIDVDFRQASGSRGVVLDRVIADTAPMRRSCLGRTASFCSSCPRKARRGSSQAWQAVQREVSPSTFASTSMAANTPAACSPIFQATIATAGISGGRDR